MFAMTELGHGSNVRAIETEATYDAATDEFVVHTPHMAARKAYIGNALDGDYAIVFAQLRVGGVSRGPHAFVVPIRHGGVLGRGVQACDMGQKEGLNGVDNGTLAFDHVRIPRSHLLNRFGSVDAHGTYTTPIASDTKRFNAMLSALVGTRIALVFSATTAMKVALAISVRYARSRRQFGPKLADPERPIAEYQTHQLRLMPLLALSVGLTFAGQHAAAQLEECLERMDEGNREVQALCAGLKAYATWKCVQVMQTCRECCGGQGYMVENRLAVMRADTDVYTTFEGDNTVLVQQVAKDLLAHYSTRFGGIWSSLMGFLVKYVCAHRIASRGASCLVRSIGVATARLPGTAIVAARRPLGMAAHGRIHPGRPVLSHDTRRVGCAARLATPIAPACWHRSVWWRNRSSHDKRYASGSSVYCTRSPSASISGCGNALVRRAAAPSLVAAVDA